MVGFLVPNSPAVGTGGGVGRCVGSGVIGFLVGESVGTLVGGLVTRTVIIFVTVVVTVVTTAFLVGALVGGTVGDVVFRSSSVGTKVWLVDGAMVSVGSIVEVTIVLGFIDNVSRKRSVSFFVRSIWRRRSQDAASKGSSGVDPKG
jgi:hypothetical protein